MTYRIGNASGFYGDRLSAMREMLSGGPLDALTGDYLAELTMLILGKDQLKNPSLGYARTFVRQAEDCLGLALEQGVRIVTNAGGLNPRGLGDRLAEVAGGLGLAPGIAYVDGDDLRGDLDVLGLVDERLGRPLTANAYLGAAAIAEALRDGADVVVTGRVTDASLVVGPALAHFGWSLSESADPADRDALAGATVAGHVIECGTQATGGNFSGFVDLTAASRARPLGFPIAELEADGSCVITKHEGTGGVVTVETVTAQLMYEVQGPAYLGPDVTTHLDSIELADAGPDRVAISGVRGSAPPASLKVCLNFLGGYRNSAELVVVGLDLEDKAAWARAQVEAALDASPTGRPAEVEWSLARTDRADADSEEAASSRLRVTVRDADAAVVDRAFTAPLVELALGSYPGFTLTATPAPATPYAVYRAGFVPRDALPAGAAGTVHHLTKAERPDSHQVSRRVVRDGPVRSEGSERAEGASGSGEDRSSAAAGPAGPPPSPPKRTYEHPGGTSQLPGGASQLPGGASRRM
ncbi:MAG: acyclic terpene utilization AtuA family protein, partial [Nocardioides sp.]